MPTEFEAELYGQLDWYIALASVLVLSSFLLSYQLMPKVIPGEAKVGLVSFFLGSSCLKYVRRPGDKPWTIDDFPNWKDGDNPQYDIQKFAAEMESMWTPKDKRRLLTRLVWHMGPWWSYSMFMAGCERTLNYINMSYTITVMITLLMSETVPGWDGPTLKLMLLGFIISVGSGAVKQWAFLIMALRGTDPFYVGLSLRVVRKMHRLSGTGMLKTNAAEAQQVAQECYYLAVNFWATPLQTLLIDVILGSLSVWKLYKQIGVVGIVVAAVSIASLFGAGTLCDRKRADLDKSSYEATVKRQMTLNVLLDSFRELRLYNWVHRAAKPLSEVRATLRSNYFWSAVYSTMGGAFTGQVDGVMTVAVCYFFAFIQQKRVDFGETQTARSYMGTLLFITMSLSACRWAWIDAVQRAQRIENFLRLPEVSPKEDSEGPLQVTDVTYAYPVAPKKDEDGKDITPAPEPVPVLMDVSLKPTEGELVLVCGAIGSGKSSLLQALLGELVLLKGERSIPNAPIAYQPQVPYLIDGTIRDNVLFGIADEDCNEKHLKQALAAAQLAVDMADPRNTLHTKGENTDVGKRGTHLSGGQRARTALARSVYAVLEGAPVALLDDPVASVDNEVVQAAWDEAVTGAMKKATRVVVVNSQLLERLASSADRLVVLSEGRIVFNGAPAEAFKDQEILSKALSGKYELVGGAAKKEVKWSWLKAGVTAVKDWAAIFGNPKEGDHFTTEHLAMVQASSPTPLTFEGLAEQKFIKEMDEEAAQQPVPPPAEVVPEELEDEANGEDSALLLADMLREREPLREFLRRPIPIPEKEDSEPLAISEAPLKLSPDDWEELRLKLRRIERKYQHSDVQGKARLTTPQLVIHFLKVGVGMFFVCMLLQVVSGFKDAVVMAALQRWAAKDKEDSDWTYFLMLIGVFVGGAVLNVTTGVLDGYGNLRITHHLMKRIDESLEALGMPFFWKKKHVAEPQIRKVVNTDLGAMSNIARLPMMCIECFILICLTSMQAPLLWFLMPVSFFGYYQMAFLPDWKNLQLWPAREQLQNTAWARVVEQWDVLPAIRGLKRQVEFERTTYQGIMVVGYSNLMSFQLEVLMQFCHHTIGAIFNAVALMIFIHLRMGGSSPTMAFAFWTLATNFSGKVNQMVNMYMPFKDLLKQYDQMQDIFCSDALETEDGIVPSAGWLSAGKIEFESVTFRYVPYLPAALKDVSIVVQPGEKLGVVGKTGSGKSTLVSLLLRLGPLRGVAPSSGGRVLLDGVDISRLRLSDLRQSIGVVPQEPTLFAMTLKENIGEEFTDAEVLTALQWCGIDARQITGKEDGPVTDALASELRTGSLSVGQQQLLMAARALVRRPKIMILDECTASLDRDSADRLLEVINTHSKDVTVLAIAHRLRFVVKSDRILVLSGGSVIAFDTPAKLLEQPDSYFAVNLRYEQKEDQSKEEDRSKEEDQSKEAAE